VNRKKLEKILARIEAEIKAGTFSYEAYFPNSKALQKLKADPKDVEALPAAPAPVAVSTAEVFEAPGIQTPAFEVFANQWVDERSIEWRRSHTKSLLSTLNGRLIPSFKGKAVGSLTKSDILAFRAALAKVPGRGGKDRLSPKRINEIIGLLCQILDEAADRFQFTTPTNGIRRLKVPKVDVNPFSLAQVESILATVRPDYRCYFTVRFFTGMRTGEVHGLKWKYVDFEHRLILVRETFVLDEDDYTKNDGSQRDIQMSQPVFDALKLQYEATGRLSEYVFCNLLGRPLDNKNFTDRIWYPLLRHLGLERRRPYQMRHTAATLWLASGEAPEWIARQMGHTTTEMLFRVYSRYVPNLTRQDGSAMERLLASRLSLAGALQDRRGTGGDSESAPLPGATAAMPVPKPRGAIARELHEQQTSGRALVRIPPGKPPPRYAAHF
jgi:integrase